MYIGKKKRTKYMCHKFKEKEEKHISICGKIYMKNVKQYI